MLEAEVRDPVVKYAKSKKVVHIRMHFGRGATVGWPDDLFLFRAGVTLFVEFKATGKQPSAIQEKKLKALREQGHFAYVIDDETAGTNLIDEFSLYAEWREKMLEEMMSAELEKAAG